MGEFCHEILDLVPLGIENAESTIDIWEKLTSPTSPTNPARVSDHLAKLSREGKVVRLSTVGRGFTWYRVT